MQQEDTIFALSTPPGKSGVAVIRVSGSEASQIAITLTKKPVPPTPRQATLAELYGVDGRTLDRTLLLFFKAPHSFTGEDILELHVHGGVAVIQAVVNELSKQKNTRAAAPGEFMRRAFYNEKADLLEAEAIADMIDAETSAQLSQASRQMKGHHSKYYKSLRNKIVEILALTEAYIDFPEEDIPKEVLADVNNATQSLKKQIDDSLDDKGVGERIRSGFRMSIVGAPNVGKSTLLNTLVGRDAAIVSEHAGTTRDVIEAHLDIEGYPILLCDTAGIHTSENEVEQLGIERSKQHVGISDILLVMLDATLVESTLPMALEIIGDSQNSDVAPIVIGVINKGDMLDDESLAALKTKVSRDLQGIYFVTASALSLDGLVELKSSIKSALDGLMPQEDVLITRERHRHLLMAASNHLSKNIAELPLEIFCEEIRLAAVHIGKMTGEVVTDELLELIFSRFCIGK